MAQLQLQQLQPQLLPHLQVLQSQPPPSTAASNPPALALVDEEQLVAESESLPHRRGDDGGSVKIQTTSIREDRGTGACSDHGCACMRMSGSDDERARTTARGNPPKPIIALPRAGNLEWMEQDAIEHGALGNGKHHGCVLGASRPHVLVLSWFPHGTEDGSTSESERYGVSNSAW
uniref:Uncharacterized protein n=1 Tax=Sorghum bicolor TaxID=4558 RepID=B3VTB5_SORBI|nr:hypothetical protein [Sorghum bicolor]